MTSKRVPERGDIVWVEFDPVIGTEQPGRRPALVLTSREFHSRSRRSVVCPITRNVEHWPTKVTLPAGCKTKGMVLADQLRAVDRAGRGFRFIEKAPASVVKTVQAIVASLVLEVA
jgi:mRNA interferase MazF